MRKILFQLINWADMSGLRTKLNLICIRDKPRCESSQPKRWKSWKCNLRKYSDIT